MEDNYYKSSLTGAEIDDALSEILSGNIKRYAEAAENSANASKEAVDRAEAAGAKAKEHSDSAKEAEKNAMTFAQHASMDADAAKEHADTAKKYAFDAAEFSQYAAREADDAKAYANLAEKVAVKTPYINDSGTWMVWDNETGAYKDSGIEARGPQGVPGTTVDLGAGIVGLYINDEGHLIVSVDNGI